MAENVGKRLEQKESKQKKTKKPSRLTKRQKWLLAVAIVLAVVLVAVVALDGLFVKPELPGKGNGSNADGTQAGDGIDYGDGVQPRVSGERKSKDYYTVLILGRDTGGGGNTDTMLLASYDVTNQKANVMSIPRDTMVNVNWDVKKINSVYNMNGGGEKGIKALYKEISQLVGFEPDYQVILEWEAVGKIVDAIGGVDLEVTEAEMDEANDALWEYCVFNDLIWDDYKFTEPGLQTLNGPQAVAYGRIRKGATGGDAARTSRQQEILEKMMEKVMDMSIVKYPSLAAKLLPMVETSLSSKEILSLAAQVLSGGKPDIERATFPCEGEWSEKRTSSGLSVVAYEDALAVKRLHAFIYDDLSIEEQKAQEQSSGGTDTDADTDTP